MRTSHVVLYIHLCPWTARNHDAIPSVLTWMTGVSDNLAPMEYGVVMWHVFGSNLCIDPIRQPSSIVALKVNDRSCCKRRVLMRHCTVDDSSPYSYPISDSLVSTCLCLKKCTFVLSELSLLHVSRGRSAACRCGICRIFAGTWLSVWCVSSRQFRSFKYRSYF